MNELVEEALKSTDLSKGVVLDGYPASKIQGDFLTGLLDTAARSRHPPERAGRRGAKAAQESEPARHRAGTQGLSPRVRLYPPIFPEADIRTVDGTKPPAEVAKQIRKMLESRPK